MSDRSKEVVIVDAARTPIGTYKGSLKNLKADRLGTLVIKEILKKSKLKIISANNLSEAAEKIIEAIK